MANVRNLRREASALLRASKRALRFIRDFPAGPASDRDALLQELREVVDRADPPSFDDSDASIRLQMTNPTAQMLLRESSDDAELLAALKEGMQLTKQRVYIRLDLNHVLLRKLQFVLDHRGERAQKGSFKRLAEVVKAGLRKNPMEILGRMGL